MRERADDNAALYIPNDPTCMPVSNRSIRNSKMFGICGENGLVFRLLFHNTHLCQARSYALLVEGFCLWCMISAALAEIPSLCRCSLTLSKRQGTGFPTQGVGGSCETCPLEDLGTGGVTQGRRKSFELDCCTTVMFSILGQLALVCICPDCISSEFWK